MRAGLRRPAGTSDTVWHLITANRHMLAAFTATLEDDCPDWGDCLDAYDIEIDSWYDLADSIVHGDAEHRALSDVWDRRSDVVHEYGLAAQATWTEDNLPTMRKRLLRQRQNLAADMIRAVRETERMRHD